MVVVHECSNISRRLFLPCDSPDRQEYFAGNRQEVHRRQGDRGAHRPWQTSSHQVKFQRLAFHM